jgi:group I intron endonuclease
MLGIYAIIHKATGRRYVGQSNNIELRFYTHRWGLDRGVHKNPKLQSAWNKYGEAEFEFVVLEQCEADNLTEREQSYMDESSHFNVNMVAEASPMLGRNHSEESRVQMSKAHKGKTLSEETKAKISAAGKRKIVTEETRVKLRSRRHTEEAKARIGAALKGRVFSEETKDKMRKAKKSRPVRCIETGQVFESTVLAAKHFSGSAGFLHNHLSGQKPSFKGHTFAYEEEQRT